MCLIFGVGGFYPKETQAITGDSRWWLFFRLAFRSISIIRKPTEPSNAVANWQDTPQAQ